MKNGIFAVWVATGVAVIFLLFFSSKQWPLVCSDSVAYWPPIIHGNESGEFNSPVWKRAANYDPQGKARLTYHGFLLQLIVRHLGGLTYPRIFIIVGCFGLVAIVAFAACLAMILAGNEGLLRRWRMAYLTCLPLAMGHLFLGVFSRPESLVMTWAALLCLALKSGINWTNRKAVITGLLLGLSGLTSPVSSILMGTMVAMFAAFKLPPFQMLTWLAIAACTALSSGIVIFFLGYPFNLSDWIFGNLNHAQKAVWTSGTADYFTYWFKEVRQTGLFPLCLASFLVLVLNRPSKDPSHISQSILRIGSFASFVGACWYFGIREPARSYNLQALAPFMLTLTGNWIVTAKREITLKFVTPFFLISSAVIACSLGFIRNVILSTYADKQGTSYHQASEALTHYLDNSKEPVDVSMQFITLSSSSKMRGVETTSQVEAEYFMMAQTYSGRTVPPKIAGYEIVYDGFTKTAPRFLGVKIASTPGGYNYAIYHRLDNAMHRESSVKQRD